MSIEQVPPHNLEAEMAVLGSMILDNTCIPGVVGTMNADMFYVTANQTVFGIFQERIAAQESCDPVILCDILRSRGCFEKVGGAAYITNLVEAVPSAANVAHYAGIVRRDALYRTLIGAASAMAARAYGRDGEAVQIAAACLNTLQELAASGKGKGLESVTDVMHRVQAQLDKVQKDGEAEKIKTSLVDLDKILDIWRGESCMILIASDPSVGKSAFMNNVVRTQGADRTFAYFSLEVPAEQVVRNIWGAEAKVSPRVLGRYRLSTEQEVNVADAAGAVSKLRLWIDDSNNIGEPQIRVRVQSLMLRERVDAVVIDHAQLVDRPTGDKGYEQYEHLVHSLKAMTKTLAIPVYIISQLTKPMGDKDCQGASMKRLYGSKAWEMDADVILLIDRAKLDTDARTITISKNRNGAPGYADVIFQRSFMRWQNADRTAPTNQED